MSTLLQRHSPQSLICFGDGERDVAQLHAYTRALAAALPAPSAHAGTVVLACTDRYRFAAALLACWLRGHTVALPANGQAATVHALASAAHVAAVLHDRDGGAGIDVRTLEQASARDVAPLALELALTAPAVVAYTSGSTRTPTPHVKTLAQLLSEPSAHLHGFALAGRRIMAAVPPYHIYGLLFGVLVPLLGGGSLSRSAKLLPAELLRELRESAAEVLIAVPPQLTALAQSQESLPPLALVFSSAGPLPATTSDALRVRGWPVTEILGSTETGGIAQRSSAQAVWRALPGVTVSITEDAKLAVDSPWLAEESARPVVTADRVQRDGGGFRHLGRSDAVVKIGGRRIDLGELEARLKQGQGVRDARVLAVETAGLRGLELLAVVESDSADKASLRRLLAEHVDPVAVPRRFRIVAQLPRSETGKLTRAALLALFDRPVPSSEEPERARGRATQDWTFPREILPDRRVRVSIPAGSGFFRGHFEGQPILPGVVQLQHIALAEARRSYPELRVLARVTRIKFRRLVEPGDTLELCLTRRGPLTVVFEVVCNGAPSASGMLHFREGEIR